MESVVDIRSQVPLPHNEPIQNYAPGSPERSRLQLQLTELAGEVRDLPMTIGGQRRMGSGSIDEVVQPHARRNVLGVTREATESDAAAAIAALSI